ncbi:MAG TPA: DUF1894 domain-containing protein [Methanoculleus sp.]|nr:DUF1894 domain-containing protein [Methanoculleus sp.]
MAPSRCINRLGPNVLLRDTGEEAINTYVRGHCNECYEIPPNFVLRDVTILLYTPMLLGFKIRNKKVLLPFVKPCCGPMLLELDAGDDDFEELRTKLRK